jgi:hypothetical protein
MLRKDFLQKVGLGTATVVLGFKSSAIARKIGIKKGLPNSTSHLEGDFIELETPNFDLKLNKDSQTIASLMPKRANGFDFVPSDWLDKRPGDGYYHLGDITMRLRSGNSGDWDRYSTALKRSPVKILKTSKSTLAAAELNPTLPDDIPLNVRRYWELQNKNLVLRYELENKTNKDVEIGSLGMPMVFNNILTKRKLKEAHHKCSFYDPYIGLDAGYLQVTRLNGHGPALVVVPDQNTPFEAYKPLLTDKTKRGITFEGFYEWMVHTKAYAENEWKKAKQWNRPSSITLKPGQKRIYSVKFLLAGEIRKIEDTLIANDRPVAVGIPGYIVPMDQEARLYIKYGQNIKSVNIEPSGALAVMKSQITKNGWKEYTVHGKKWGRSRLTITYEDGFEQSVNYKVLKPQRQVLKDLGNFLVTTQWFDRKNDIFNRNPSIISYDYFAKKQVTQEHRAWIAGLSDEGGNGSWVATMMKQLIDPDIEELDKIQQFVNGVMDGGLQYNSGDHKYGVRKSMFYYDPPKVLKGTYDPNIKFGGWESWNEKQARSVGRSYDYTPVAAAHWMLYRLARNYEGLVTNHDWRWYLKRAYQTAMAMKEYAPHYAKFGQMEGTVYVMILEDLKREGWTDFADKYEEMMKKRAKYWKTLAYPFGSEMPWDSTGQEEVYAWCRYFGYNEKTQITLDAVTGYMPTVPHWGYNGSARRYWDFLFAGKLQRLERQLHHYGSGLNAIPVLTAYRDNPDDIYLLRVGYGGLMGAISNITEDGFGPCAFHSFPETLEIDGYSGDYGPNFLGHAINTGTYVVNHPEFGWQTFGGNQKVNNEWVEVIPLDSSRSRVYLASKGLWLTLDSGKIRKVRFNKDTDTIQLTLDSMSVHAPAARLRIEQPGTKSKKVQFQPAQNYQMERGAYVIPLKKENIEVELRQV